MKTSSLEITDQEYLIKLRKEDFDLSFINRLVKQIQAEQFFFNRNSIEEPGEDIISRRAYQDLSARFDHLNEK